MNKLEEAKLLCKEKHETAIYYLEGKALPYYVHPFAVAEIIGQTVKEPIDMDYALTLAYLHDILEDTDTTYGMLKKQFGKDVADGVFALTKNKNLPFDEQLKDSVERILTLPNEVAIVKMADRICNISQLNPEWTKEKHAHYLEETKFIFEKLHDASESLSKLFGKTINEYENKIKGEKYMRYFAYNNKIFAYETEYGIMAEFNGKNWELSEYDYGTLGRDDRVEEISEAEAIKKTNNSSPDDFFSEYLAYLSKGE